MKYIIFVSCLLLASQLSKSQWSGSGSIYYNGGNVGIGTTTPGFEMDILGSDPRYNIKATSSSSNPGYVMRNSSDDLASLFIGGSSSSYAGLAGFYTNSSNGFAILNNSGAQILRAQQNGNIGIGTATPGVKLHIADLSTPPAITLGVNAGSGGYTALVTELSAVSGGYASVQSVKSAGSAWGDIVFNPSGGNIGIGTTNPGPYKLAVEGTLGARKVKVTQATPWADYVFHSNYRLRPLSEVEQYIQQYHHLPEVPSAAEVEKDGLDLGDNQATLLKKIEELTLYIINMNKELESLKKEIRQNKLINPQLN